MKVVGIVGSPRKNGNTQALVAHALKAVSEEGIETEIVPLAGLDIRPCDACRACARGERCAIEDDFFPVYLKMKEAEGVIIGSPVYFGSASALVKSVIERAGQIARLNGDLFKGKVGGPLVVARRAGHNFTFAQLTLWYQILGMVVPGSSYWNIAFKRERGELEKDEEGLRTAWDFGKNVATVIKKLAG